MATPPTRASTVKALLCGVAVGLLVHLLPEPLAVRVATALYLACCGLVVPLAWILWHVARLMRANVEPLRDAARRAAEFAARVESYEAWRARVLDAAKRLRALHVARGERDAAAVYDGLICDMEGASAPGGDA